MLESIGAEVLAKDGSGDPVFTVNRFGSGYVYMLYFPLETMLWNIPLAFTGEETPDHARIYRMIASDVLKQHPIRHECRQIGMTLHEFDGGYYAVLVNYDDRTHDARITLNGDYEMTAVYGDVSAIEKCSMAAVRLTKKK